MSDTTAIITYLRWTVRCKRCWRARLFPYQIIGTLLSYQTAADWRSVWGNILCQRTNWNHQTHPPTAHRKPRQKISIEELLRKEPMSKVTFQAIFKQIYGDTPYAHIKKYKMNLAAVYLQETDQSITQIAGELGYSNISKFARVFKKCLECFQRITVKQKVI